MGDEKITRHIIQFGGGKQVVLFTEDADLEALARKAGYLLKEAFERYGSSVETSTEGANVHGMAALDVVSRLLKENTNLQAECIALKKKVDRYEEEQRRMSELGEFLGLDDKS